MRYTNWCRGAGLAAAAGLGTALFLPAIADATSFCITCGSTTPNVSIKFSGVSSESEPGSTGGDNGVNGGSCTSLGVCNETTWAVGNINSVKDGNKNTLFSDGGSNQVAFMIYGIGDLSIVAGTGADAGKFVISNTGSNNTGQWSGADGSIHLDLYEYTGNNINFSGPSGVNTAARTGFNSVTGVTTGLTGETFLAGFNFIPGIDPSNSSTTMLQKDDGTTDPTTGTGNFYADCETGACGEFNNNGDPEGNSILAALFGAFTLTPESGDPPTCTGPDTECANGWVGDINDPNVASVPVPEPTSLALLGSALAFFGAVIRRRRRITSA